MRTVLECLLAFFATAGFFTFLWLAFGRLLSPVPKGRPFYALLPVWGDAEDAEQQVQHLLWLQGGNLARFRIILVNQGLSLQGKEQITALTQRDPALVLLEKEQLPGLIEKDV